MFGKRLVSLRPLVVLLPSLLIAACDRRGDDDDGITPTGMADVRVAHVAPNAPSVDVFVDDALEPEVIDLAFAEGTDFIELDAGTHDFFFTTTGTPVDMAVISVPGLDLVEDRAYTIAAFGAVENLDALVIEEDLAEAPMENVRIRAIHVAPQVGSVDLSEVVDGAAPTPLVTDLAYGAFSDVIEVPAEPFVLGLDADDDATPDLLFEIPALLPGTTANVYAVSDMPGEVFLLVQVGAGELSRIMPTTAPPATPTPVPPAPLP